MKRSRRETEVLTLPAHGRSYSSPADLLSVLARLAPLCPLLVACGGSLPNSTGPTITTHEISVHDGRVFNPSARVSVDFSRRDVSPSDPHTGHAVEVGVARTRGSSSQTLSAGDLPVVLGGETIGAPNELRHEFDFGFYEIAYRYRKFFGASQRFGIEGLGGLAFADLNLTISSATQRATERLGSGGVVGSLGGIWRIRPGMSLQTRATAFVSGDDEKVTDAGRFELHLTQALGRHALVRGGWTWWHVKSERQTQDNLSSTNSHIELQFSGPALALEATF